MVAFWAKRSPCLLQRRHPSLPTLRGSASSQALIITLAVDAGSEEEPGLLLLPGDWLAVRGTWGHRKYSQREDPGWQFGGAPCAASLGQGSCPPRRLMVMLNTQLMILQCVQEEVSGRGARCLTQTSPGAERQLRTPLSVTDALSLYTSLYLILRSHLPWVNIVTIFL